MISDSVLSNIPQRPGVYVFKGQKKSVLYVGKAKNLKNRLRSYFQDSADIDPRKRAMVKMIKNFSYIVTDNELEALILEANLIKQHKPRFNIILRDDKSYPYIKLTVTEEWPRIEVVRKIAKDGNLYFGPYVPSQAMWEAVAFIRRNFPIRTCRYSLNKPVRPCIQYQMKRCSAPCGGHITGQEYKNIVEDVRLFLMGEKKELIKKLEERMQKLSDGMKFEEAAEVRDRLLMLQRAFESQKVVAPEIGDADVIGYYREEAKMSGKIAIRILFLRNGILIGARDFFIDKAITQNEAEIIHSFIELFYAKEIIPPPVILTNVIPAEAKALTAWLGDKRGSRVRIEKPSEGKKFEILRMANENARLVFDSKEKAPLEEMMSILKERLNLKKVPLSIGAFDVSTIQGSESVGAFIWWENNEFKKELYRHLRIKDVQGMDDYSMMKEIVGRTLKNLDGRIPDLIIIDGGKGQLEVARKAMGELKIETELIGIAKKPDRAFLLNDEIIELQDGSKASLLLKKIRDEVHRFAVGFHRKLRDKRLMESPLEKIHGIGRKRRLELLRYFGSIDKIRKASVNDIIKIKGFNRKIAERLLQEVRRDER
jgi:excinuclease ABC subunit C